MAALLPPPLVAFIPDNVPEALRKSQRWAPWRAVWNEKKRKYEKVPHRATRPEYGLSNKNATGWVSFTDAVAAYEANRTGPTLRDANGKPIIFGGVGYLMTGPHGVTGVDLDKCRDPQTGEIDPWAAELVARLDTYTEVSPSGTGLHAMLLGDVPEDWANHDQGVEVYGGNAARFLCITGERVPGSRAALKAPPGGYMEEVAGKYRKAPTLAQVEDLHLPDLLPVEFLPELAELDLPPHARNFLTEGPGPGDRSRQLINAATALAETGLPPDEVLSLLEANEFAMEVALDHRQQDYDKALRFLWRHSAVAGSKRAENFKQLSLDEFDDLEPGEAPAQQAEESTTGGILDDFEVLDDEPAPPAAKRDLAPVKRPRFAPESAAQFLRHSAPTWIIKGVLPHAGLAVIYGASSSGKTFFTLDMVASVARGVEWRGIKVKKGRVLYVVAEGAGGFRNRLQAYCTEHGLTPEGFDILFLRQAPNLMTKDDIREFLKEILLHGKFDLIVIDTYARAMAGGNENDAKDVGQAVAHCDIIHRKTGAMVILVHHSGKDATKGARGSGALRAAADLEIEVVQTREYRAATVTKQKDGADGVEYRFKLSEVPIDMDEDGEIVTSCVVAHCDEAEAGERKLNPEGVNEKLIFNYMEEAPDGSMSRDELIEKAAGMIELEVAPGQKDRRKERITRALKSLVRKNLLEDDGLVVSLK